MLDQINELTEIIVRNPTPTQRKIIAPLVTLELYSRDTIKSLMDPNSDNCSTLPTDFGWQKQLRHYWVLNQKELNDNLVDAPTAEFGDYILKN